MGRYESNRSRREFLAALAGTGALTLLRISSYQPGWTRTPHRSYPGRSR